MGEGHTDPNNADRAHDRNATEPTGQPTEHRATVGEAAGILGLTAEAVRSRIKRGTLKSIKEGGTVYVLLEGLTGYGQKRALEQTVSNTKKGTDWTGPPPKSDRTATEHDGTDAQASPEPDQTSDRAELVDVLRDQVEYLREQLGEEREARRRADMLLARLAEANASMAGQIRELVSPERPLDGPESDPGDAGPTDTPEPHADAQEAEETARRPWWLRWMGG